MYGGQVRAGRGVFSNGFVVGKPSSLSLCIPGKCESIYPGVLTRQCIVEHVVLNAPLQDPGSALSHRPGMHEN